MNVRNVNRTENPKVINMEIEHPVYGWIPFSASSLDTEQSGRDLYAQAINGDFGLIPPYIKPLSQAQEEKILSLKQSYDMDLQLPMLYVNNTFQADASSQKLIVDVLTASGGHLPLNFGWYDVNNIKVSMTFADLQGLAREILERGQILFDKLQQLKTQVTIATSIAEVEAVIW